ncbi:hypothetical protein CDIK_3719 [Cucumispora dikerogammari]|nr:hypothetical protein CDIK_3719 [Cucumispora dikerogammari]
MNINVERKKLLDEFDIYIDCLIDEIIHTNKLIHLLISGYDCLNFVSPGSKELPSLRYLGQQKIFRKLFFVDLVFYCHYYFSKINSILTVSFSSYKTICFIGVYKLFHDLASAQIFIFELIEFIVYINEISFSNHNFSYFIERLETRIYEKTNNPIKNLPFVYI